ncbi:MAG: pyridoxal phosphate-dependent aminotransferase [Desulfovibrio sp.]|uniref:pyridoxal phosphate-dependent aminotransferase n=1 Tax=Desulfovibrio sp. TaxID=885 RepID=UPI0025C472BE|nr:pyridoxal phosphate-dependent aminotransferase [Desulfovibrio sp.]MCI7568482.1 pyridoxal phosphate-dependent aminotransferase [Desulfovibrio sp.]
MTAQRVDGVSPFLAMEVLERAQQLERRGVPVIHLELGEPDFATPACIRDAAVAALDEGYTHYTHSLGDCDLREVLAGFYARRYGVRLHPDQFLIFPGSSPAMMLLFAALLDPGDEVIVSNPCYACYPNFVRFAGGVPVSVPTSEEEGFQFRPEETAARVTSATRAILINSPCNPTGIVLEPARMRALAGLGPLIISDEIYHGLTYGDAEEHSILEFTENAVVIGGFSKAYAMTGWRLGYLIVPRRLIRPMQALMQNFFLSTNSAVQRAGIAALTCADADVARMRDIYDERRRFLLDALPKLGFRIPVEPKGAFYMLINARHLGADSRTLAFDLLEKAHIGVTPGIDFGSGTEGFLRLSYANSLENLREAMRRLELYIKDVDGGTRS